MHSEDPDYLYFIDWEWTKKASIFFDVLHLTSIHSMYLKNYTIIKNTIELSSTSNDFERLVSATLDRFMSWSEFTIEFRRMLMAIFLAEEVLFYMDFFSDCINNLLEEIEGWYDLGKGALV